MPATSPIADTKNVRQSRSIADFSAIKLATIQFLQPGVLPVLALALIVGGWSYGLKLSHYFHSDVTKASTTRMWLDHRNETAAAPAQQPQTPQKFLSLDLSVVAVPTLPRLSREQVIAEPAQARSVEFVSALHPLRAPPISLSLA